MSKSILNKLRCEVLKKKKSGKTLWEAGTNFKILLTIERSWTPEKSKTCSKLEICFEKPRLAEVKLPNWLILPYSGLDSLVLELPVVIMLKSTGIQCQSLIFSQLPLQLLKTVIGNSEHTKIGTMLFCYTRNASVATSNMKHFRRAKVAFFRIFLTLTGHRWQTNSEINSSPSFYYKHW